LAARSEASQCEPAPGRSRADAHTMQMLFMFTS
jgi:hypothetical protein